MTNRKHKKSKWLCAILATMIGLTMNPSFTKAEEYWPEGPKIDTPSAMVVEVNSGTILYEKDSHEENYPASITKILTTLLALENSELDEIVTFSADAIKETPRDSSHIARDVGEEMTMEQCLYAVMLESANECAYAVAEHVGTKLGGGYETFIDLMNSRAKELGCKNTHFNNSNGLPDEEHYTSAYDMALIAAEAYRNETFRIITSTIKYQIPPTNKHDEITYMANHHKLLHRYKNSDVVYEYCTGGKTGYTKAAGYTLVSFAEKDGLALACVVMDTTSKAEWADTTELFEYCFENFKTFTISDYETDTPNNEQDNGVMNHYGSYVSMDENAYIVMPAAAEFKDAKANRTDIKGSGNAIAQIEYTYADRVVGKVDIIASGSHVEENYFDEPVPDEDEPQKTVVKIKPVYIIGIVVAIAVLILLIIIVKKLYDNYYVILHNMEVRKMRKERFRPVSTKKRRWRKKDRMFR